jgi:CheY-like chemotaxis protein
MDVEVSVLLIEPKDDLRQSLRELLEREGYAVAEASDGRDGLFQFHLHPPDLMIIDAIAKPISRTEVLARAGALTRFRKLPRTET